MRIGDWGLGIGRLGRRRALTPYFLLFSILALAAALRFYALTASSLWSDEGNTWALMGRSFAQIAKDAAADIHPPGYYWLLKVWTLAWGESALALRSFTAVLGVVLVLLVYAIVQNLVQPSADHPADTRASQVRDLAGPSQKIQERPAGSRTRLEHEEMPDRLHRYVPARLSLHRADALPFAPDHPWLAGETDPRPIPVPGGLEMAGWRLVAHLCTRAELPKRWVDLSAWEAYFDADVLGTPILAGPRPALFFSPLGMEGQRKSLGDLFTDCKIPLSLRAGWPLILSQSGQVVWVCGVQMGHECRITPQTQRIAHLSWGEI